jgi:NAD(P)-dependent dehydrogenase (short-subunit alcohol dehydrogenase family)
MDALCAEIGRIDWLVMTMSSAEGAGAFSSLDLDTLRGAFDAKFWGYLTGVQAALPHLAPDASVTLVSAGSARSSIPGSAGLAAVNGAIEAMIKPLAIELAPVRVNAISPGLVDTPWWSAMPEGMRNDFFATIGEMLPVGRVATAEDVAEAVALAATNRNLTGTVIETDGGARLVSFPDPARAAATTV